MRRSRSYGAVRCAIRGCEKQGPQLFQVAVGAVARLGSCVLSSRQVRSGEVMSCHLTSPRVMSCHDVLPLGCLLETPRNGPKTEAISGPKTPRLNPARKRFGKALARPRARPENSLHPLAKKMARALPKGTDLQATTPASSSTCLCTRILLRRQPPLATGSADFINKYFIIIYNNI